MLQNVIAFELWQGWDFGKVGGGGALHARQLGLFRFRVSSLAKNSSRPSRNFDSSSNQTTCKQFSSRHSSSPLDHKQLRGSSWQSSHKQLKIGNWNLVKFECLRSGQNFHIFNHEFWFILFRKTGACEAVPKQSLPARTGRRSALLHAAAAAAAAACIARKACCW